MFLWNSNIGLSSCLRGPDVVAELAAHLHGWTKVDEKAYLVGAADATPGQRLILHAAPKKQNPENPANPVNPVWPFVPTVGAISQRGGRG